MKNRLLPLLILLIALAPASGLTAQELFRAGFEDFDSTPYYFRFGNKGSRDEYTYKPRWMYSHEVTDNPLKQSPNSSAKVLEYTTMEARNYGLKFRFGTPVSINDLQTVSFKIYQPANVIGKEVESAYSAAPATQQNLCVKLLSYFNPVIDFNQDEGILLYKEKIEFSREGEWVEVNLSFNKNDYSSQLSKFANGVLGIAILPTYDADVTLKESQRYVCYIDDIVINKSATAIGDVLNDEFGVDYSGGELHICAQNAGAGILSIYDMQGKALYEGMPTDNRISIELSKGIYLIKYEVNGKSYQDKLIVNQK